nr:hypothetical protein [Tanacetum cinerariifolium]
MGKDTVQLETAVTTISQEYLLEFTSEYGISEALHPKLPGPEDRIVDFPEGKIYLSQLSVIGAAKQEAGEKYPSMLYQAIRFPKKLEQPLLLGGREGVLDYCGLAYKCSEGWDASREYVFPRGSDDTEHTSYPNPEKTMSTTLLSRVEPQILPGRRDMDLFSLIRALNPTKVKTGSRPRAAHEVPLLTVTANRVIEMEDPTATTDSSGGAAAPEVAPSENVTTTGVAPEAGQAKGVAATGPHVVKERRKRGHDGVNKNAPLKVLRRDHADPRPTESTRGGKSLAAIELGMGSISPVLASQGAPRISSKGAATAGDPKSENTSFTSMVGSPESIYRPEWGITNGCLLDAPEARQDLADHISPPGYFLELRHLHNDDFLKQYNVNLARQVAMWSQLRLRENEINNLETLLEAETDMMKAAKNRSAELGKELESTRALCSDLQVSNNRLSQQVSTLQAHVMGEEKLKAAFEEFKQYEDNRVEQRCVKMDARLDALSIDFDEELYPHMLTAITGRRWVIGHGLRLAVMKCGESTELRQVFANVVSVGIAKGMSERLKHGVEHENADLNLEAIEAYDPEVEAKYIAALHALKELKYHIWIRELRPSSSQLTIPVYPEARDPTDPWACKEEILLADAIAANVSRAKKKKKSRMVCRTHGVGSAHHARSDCVPVSVPTVAPQSLAILLADAATQTEISKDGASPKLLRSSSFLLCIVETSHSTACVSYVLRGSLCVHTQRLGCMSLRTQSQRPLGLQPVYAAGRL